MISKSDLDVMIQKAFNKRETKLKKLLEENRRFEEFKKEKNANKVIKLASRFMSIPIIIGISAAVIMYNMFGPIKLIETLLSWIIGLTILATTVALLEKYGNFF